MVNIGRESSVVCSLSCRFVYFRLILWHLINPSCNSVFDDNFGLDLMMILITISSANLNPIIVILITGDWKDLNLETLMSTIIAIVITVMVV